MEAQYYTPTIDEFHVGFEYETNYLSKEWEKRTLKIDEADWFFDTYYKDATSVEFRVKHLDRQDIEECGWKFSNKSNVNNYVFDKLPYRMNVCFFDGSDKTPKISIYVNDGEIANNIIIKNKSELRKIMQQCGISA